MVISILPNLSNTDLFTSQVMSNLFCYYLLNFDIYLLAFK